MANCRCSNKKCTQNVERKMPSEILKERGSEIHFRLLFWTRMAKLEKFSLKVSRSELDFVLLAQWYHFFFSASLHWLSHFYENGPLLVGFRCCECVFALLNFWSDNSLDVVPLKDHFIHEFNQVPGLMIYIKLLLCKKKRKKK